MPEDTLNRRLATLDLALQQKTHVELAYTILKLNRMGKLTQSSYTTVLMCFYPLTHL